MTKVTFNVVNVNEVLKKFYPKELAPLRESGVQPFVAPISWRSIPWWRRAWWRLTWPGWKYHAFRSEVRWAFFAHVLKKLEVRKLDG